MADVGKSGYKVLNIVLVESVFKRTDAINMGGDVTSPVDISTGYEMKENLLFCNVTVKYESIYKEQKQIEALVKMIGVFEKIGESKLDIEKFGKINAPSIVFPYVREHLSSLSVKAGLNPVLLPPVNFVAMGEEQKK